jgi:hypothetical protein
MPFQNKLSTLRYIHSFIMDQKCTGSADTSSTTIEKADVQEDSATARAQSSDSPPATAASFKEEPQPEGEAEPEYVTGIRLLLTLFGLTLVAVLVMMDQTILVVVCQ